MENKHVVPRENGWAVKSAGSERATKIFSVRDEAINYAKELAVKHDVCMVVHDEYGKFKEFDCKPEVSKGKNQHVVKRADSWGVITAGSNLTEIYSSKGAAMAQAYNFAVDNNSCMLIHGADGKIKSVTCPPEGEPGFLEVLRMRMKI